MMTITPRTFDASYQVLPFPMKLYAMLEDSSLLGFEDIVSWQPSGTSFKVFDAERFQSEILKVYFNQNKYKSFQRQLNSYGFKRIQTGPTKGGYIHKLFSEGQAELCKGMFRKPQKHTPAALMKNKQFTDDLKMEQECLDHLLSQRPSSSGQRNVEIDDKEVKPLYDFFFPQNPLDKDVMSSFFQVDDDLFEMEDNANKDTVICSTVIEELPSLPAFFTSLSDPSSAHLFSWSPAEQHKAHESLLDISTVMDDVDFNEFLPMLNDVSGDGSECSLFNDDAKPEQDSTSPFLPEDANQEISFPWKLHLMLESAEKDGYQHIVSWVREGSAFKVHDTKAFVDEVMPHYFDQTKYESFRRQLNLYGFNRVAKGPQRGVISHENFQQGARWLCGKVNKKAQS